MRLLSAAPDRDATYPGDEFWDWVAPHWALMARVAGRMCARGDVEDVLQDTALLAWRKQHIYDPARGSARTWLLALTCDQARRSRRSSTALAVADVPEVVLHTEPILVTRLDVERAVRRLPRRQREVVTLYYLLDLPIDEIARILRCSTGTVKSTLHDARQALSRSIPGRDEQ